MKKDLVYGPQPEFGLGAATAGHNRPVQSVGQRRPTQDQPRDMPQRATAYQRPSAVYADPAAGRVPNGTESGFGRPGAGPATGAAAPPGYASAPSGSSVQQDHTGMQPNVSGERPGSSMPWARNQIAVPNSSDIGITRADLDAARAFARGEIPGEVAARVGGSMGAPNFSSMGDRASAGEQGSANVQAVFALRDSNTRGPR